MVDAIIRYIAGALGVSAASLKKSDEGWDLARSIVTPEQLARIQQIIEDHHAGFAAGVVGPDIIRPDELARLRSEGLIPPEAGDHLFLQSGPLPRVKTPRPWPATGYDYGAYQGASDAKANKKLAAMTPREFAAYRESVELPLTSSERQARQWARQNAGQFIRGAGSRVSMEVTAAVLQADAREHRQFVGAVAEETAMAIEKRKPWRQLAQDLGNRTGDWSQDMRRIAATETEFARQEGQMRSMSRGREPKEIRVAKIPAPNACKDCVRLHLTAGVGSPPKIFLLSELQANGNNVGRKRADWRAGVGPVHPYCACVMSEVPDGYGFDAEGILVPETMLKKAGYAENITYGDIVPEKGVVIRIGDPEQRAMAQMVIDQAPPEIFDKRVGVTLITTDSARLASPLEDGDYAYWTGNEITINRTLDPSRIPRVLRHELGHSLNVWLFHKTGRGVAGVRAWHEYLDEISREEGYVSQYASREPIENAAEVTRMYLFERETLAAEFPEQYEACHDAYKEIFQ